MHFKIEILQQIIDIVCLNCIEKCCIVITFENIFLDPKNLGMNDKYKSNIYRKWKYPILILNCSTPVNAK